MTLTAEGLTRSFHDRRQRRGGPHIIISARVRSVLFWAACAILPIALLAVVSAWGGVYPFGPESFLTEDLKFQYIDFFSWFRRVLTGDANIFYSFAQGMGSNAWGLYSYYLASPFNLIVLLFDEAHLTLAIYAIVGLKLSCTSISMAWYLLRRFDLDRMWALTLALCYTWSTWAATNLRNPLWLDALILLPLLAWGCHLLIREGRIIMLSLLVAADVITCWYMAYITLLFSCLFVLFELGVMGFEQGWPRPRWIAGRAARFTGAIALGMGLAAWTFVPTVLAMAGGGVSSEIPLQVTGRADVLKGFLPGSWDLDSTPQFYAGLIPLCLFLGFLCSREVPRQVRIMAAAFGAFIAASALLGPLMFVWCGLRMPTGFYCRFAFLMGFLEVWAAGYLLMRRAERPRSHARGPHAPWIEGGGAKGPGPEPGLRRLVPVVAVALTLIDLGLNAHLCWDQLYVNYPQETHDSYLDAVDAQMRELDELDADAFYRVDKTYNRATAAFNEGISHGFNQLSTYSSANNPKAVSFLNALGYSSEGEFSSVYAAPNLVMDSLLGVRYIGSWSKPVGTIPTGIEGASIVSPLYRNPYALSLGLPTDAERIGGELPEGDDPFERQNALFAQITGIKEPLYTELEGDVATRTDRQITWSVELPASCIGYVYVQTGEESDWAQYVSMLIDDELIPMEGTRFAHNVRSFGDVSAMSTQHAISVMADARQSELPSETTCAIYALNIEVFERGIEQLREGQFVPREFRDGYVSGTYHAERAVDLVLSIPYDGGWTVTVDGDRVDLSPAFGGGMSMLELDAGNHAIEMTYRSPGFLPGCILSMCSAALICAYGLIRSKQGDRERQTR